MTTLKALWSLVLLLGFLTMVCVLAGFAGRNLFEALVYGWGVLR